MTVDLGDLYPITMETRLAPTAQQLEDGDPGTLVDVTDVTITVTTPDGTSLTPVVLTASTSTGQYDYDYPCVDVGLHHWTGVSTGVVVASVSGVFVVSPAGAQSIVSVDEVVSQMGAESTITGDDREELRSMCVAATSAVQNDLYRVLVRTTVVETHDGGCSAIFLRKTPVQSITSVVESGATLATTGEYTLNGRLGILYRGSQQAVYAFAGGIQNVVVTYVAVPEELPEFVRKVVKNTVIKMWQSSRQKPHPYLDGQLDSNAAVVQATAQLTGPEFRAYEAYRMVAG
jgi:hypothetical protein